MKIKLIRNEGCHIWQTAEKVLKETLTEAGLPDGYEVVVIKDDQNAQKYRFFGSPQITIDGVDVDTQAAKATAFKTEGCRVYVWEDKMYEYPPKEMLLQRLKVSLGT